MESSWNMDRNEWYRVGEDIRDQVQRAVETGDFVNLGKTIGDTVNRAVSDVNNSISSVGAEVNKVSHGKNTKYRKPNIRPDARLFDRHPKGEIAGIVCMAVGIQFHGDFCPGAGRASAQIPAARRRCGTFGYGGGGIPGWIHSGILWGRG